MKNTFLLKWIGFAALSILCVTLSYARSTAPLVITSAETPQNIQRDDSQLITVTIHNNVPTAPVKLNMAANKTKLTPSSPLVTTVITNDCQYNGMADYVPPSGGCNLLLNITAGSTVGQVSQQLIINYGPTFQTIAPAPAFNYSIISGGGGGNLTFTLVPTGQDMPTNSHQELIWTLSNSTASAIPLNPAGIYFTVASPLIATPVFTNDCNNSVPASGVCHVYTTIQSLSTSGHVSQYLQVTYNGTSTLIVDTPTDFNITGSSAGTRTFSFVNMCPYSVWFAFHGGGQLNNCTSDADCDAKPGVTAGTFACNSTANGGLGQCFWKNPTPANGNYELEAKTGTNVVVLTERVYSPTPQQPIVWSGAIAGRTGCSSGTCETADCGGGGTGACSVGVGFNQPAMQIEPTLQTNTDNYDITSINGLNVPASIEPVNATRDSFNPYTCGSSGITSNQTSSGGTIGGCSWSFTPPSNAYIWVKNSATTCTVNSNCDQANGEACGLSSTGISSNSTQTVCGQFLGYWTANQVCALNSSYSGAPFLCTNAADGGTTFAQMYGCNAGGYVNSCYTTGGQTACCGCQNWQEAPSSLLIPSNNNVVQQCAASGNGSSNATWVSNVLNTLTWYKAACPPNYVYPYDDKSSSYTCSNSATANHVNYKITFCPGGNSGAPPGTIQS